MGLAFPAANRQRGDGKSSSSRRRARRPASRKNGEEMLDASSNAASGPKLKPPSGAMVLAEARALIEWNACLMMTPVLMTAPRGDGHPVWFYLVSSLAICRRRCFVATSAGSAMSRTPGTSAAISAASIACASSCANVWRSFTKRRSARSALSAEPRRRLRARSRAADAGSRAVGHHARQPLRQRRNRQQHPQTLRAAVGRVDFRRQDRGHSGARRRSSGPCDVDLHQERRHRPLAHLPVAGKRTGGDIELVLAGSSGLGVNAAALW